MMVNNTDRFDGAVCTTRLTTYRIVTSYPENGSQRYKTRTLSNGLHLNDSNTSDLQTIHHNFSRTEMLI